MLTFKSRTLQDYITRILTFFSILFLLLAFTIMQKEGWQAWNTGLAMVLIILFLYLSILNFRKRILASFGRALLHIEAVKAEDYNQHAKSEFAEGVTADLHSELSRLSQQLQTHKSQYDQHAFLLYQLIDQLDTPMMVFNQKQKLTYANAAFSVLYNQPWQIYRLASPRLLGLNQTDKGWQLLNKGQQWHINHSEFIDAGEQHQLLVFTNIDSALRANQLNAWQQIIRVMAHEIRNSLTPVSSLAESLSGKLDSSNTPGSPREKQALEIISERCHHLQEFVDRYSSLSQQFNLNIQQIDTTLFTQRLKGLFTSIDLSFSIAVEIFWADPIFIEQVCINLIKNSQEAKAKCVKIIFSEENKKCVIKIIDDGHGFANIENLFVPLFTTKQQGQGIGLIFCRNIIEQHGGSLEMNNNPPTQAGMTATISIPFISKPLSEK